uniref:(northern house mosquito) hypothetical protein n=1 Tax=Culex pipiens TaxID=7175 RepID=A0A8D8NWE6_CULPI
MGTVLILPPATDCASNRANVFPEVRNAFAAPNPAIPAPKINTSTYAFGPCSIRVVRSLINLLVARGANVNSTTTDRGRTPLHEAVEDGSASRRRRAILSHPPF